MFQTVKTWLKKNVAPVVILGACFLGITNWGFISYQFSSIVLFVAIAIAYGIFHIDGFWDKLKSIYKSKI